MKIVFAVGVVTLIGLLSYLAYMQNASQNKKIKTLNSSVVELQGQVKELQKQVNNNVSFGTQQSLDALIHQIESEIDNQGDIIPSEQMIHPEVHQSGGMLMDEGNNSIQNETPNDMDGVTPEELYQELESELTNELNASSVFVEDNVGIQVQESGVEVEEVEEVEDTNLNHEEQISLIDDQLDDEEETDEDETDEEETDEEDDEETDEEEDEVDDDIQEDNVKELQNEVEDDFMEKLNEFYLSKTQAELRSLCRKHKKPFSGNKQTLVTRILQVDKLRNVTLE